MQHHILVHHIHNAIGDTRVYSMFDLILLEQNMLCRQICQYVEISMHCYIAALPVSCTEFA